jgi:hypothetical protein
VRSPILSASGRIEGENIEFRGTDQSVIYHDQTGLEGCELTDIISAQDLELGSIALIDLVERGETL